MAELRGQPAEVRFTLTIVRKATGKVEQHEMVGHVTPPKNTAAPEEQHGHHPLDGGA